MDTVRAGLVLARAGADCIGRPRSCAAGACSAGGACSVVGNAAVGNAARACAVRACAEAACVVGDCAVRACVVGACTVGACTACTSCTGGADVSATGSCSASASPATARGADACCASVPGETRRVLCAPAGLGLSTAYRTASSASMSRESPSSFPPGSETRRRLARRFARGRPPRGLSTSSAASLAAGAACSASGAACSAPPAPNPASPPPASPGGCGAGAARVAACGEALRGASADADADAGDWSWVLSCELAHDSSSDADDESLYHHSSARMRGCADARRRGGTSRGQGGCREATARTQDRPPRAGVLVHAQLQLPAGPLAALCHSAFAVPLCGTAKTAAI